VEDLLLRLLFQLTSIPIQNLLLISMGGHEADIVDTRPTALGPEQGATSGKGMYVSQGDASGEGHDDDEQVERFRLDGTKEILDEQQKRM